MVRKAVGAIIVDEKDNYLLIHKVEIKDSRIEKNMDAWDFVKGGIKTGESSRQAVVRELWEETGSEEYVIEKQYSEKISFNFSPSVSEINGFSSQETTMFLVRFKGVKTNLKANDDEIDEVKFFDKAVIREMLSTQETIDFWDKNLYKSSN